MNHPQPKRDSMKLKQYLKENSKYDNDDWVLVQNGKVVKYFKNPKNNKAPDKFTQSKDQEMMRISHAKKNGIKIDESIINEEIIRRIYFAHPQMYYNTKWETKCIQMIMKKWPDHQVVNPNQHDRFDRVIKKSGFQIFYQMVKLCEFGTFMPLQDGRWSGGVFKEALMTKKQGKDVWEVNPWKGSIKPMKISGVKPIAKDDPYYKQFSWDEDEVK